MQKFSKNAKNAKIASKLNIAMNASEAKNAKMQRI